MDGHTAETDTVDILAATRRSLHGIAELLIAGPQYRSHKTIRLAAYPGGFGGAQLPIRIEGTDLVWSGGRTPLAGSCRDLATSAGVEPGAPTGLYKDTSGVQLDEQLTIDPAAVRLILDWFGVGDSALRIFSPNEQPVLWPEHFDLGIVAGEVNYGVSPGDSEHPRPYAYVGPWKKMPGSFWNAPFGALRSSDQLGSVESLVDFFTEGRAAAASS